MSYQNDINTVIKQMNEWRQRENHEVATEYLQVLFKAILAKYPGDDAMRSFVVAVKQQLHVLTEKQMISSLQASVWLDKTLKLAEKH